MLRFYSGRVNAGTLRGGFVIGLLVTVGRGNLDCRAAFVVRAVLALAFSPPTYRHRPPLPAGLYVHAHQCRGRRQASCGVGEDSLEAGPLGGKRQLGGSEP